MFSPSQTLGFFWQYFASALIFGVLPTLIISSVSFLAVRAIDKRGANAAIATAFSAFGSVIGILTGASREPVLGGMLPLILSMVTVFITFIVERKNSVGVKNNYMIALTCFFIGTIFGAFYGASYRNDTR
jgi:hypothetical protein